jgi:hypothetical protein
MIKVTAGGNFKNTETLLRKASNINLRPILEEYGRLGVDALARNTPVDTGKTAKSWDYEIVYGKNEVKLIWVNDNMAENTDIPVAMLIQYGHATKNGGYVTGIDYINPALTKLFDKMADKAWREVSKVT